MTELEKLKENVEEIKNQLEELKAKIEELEQGTQEETDNRWKPEVGKDFWRVSVGGDVYKAEWENDHFDDNVFNHTDIFPTEEQAIFDRERKCIRRELMKYGRTFDPSVRNWMFDYNYHDKTFSYWNLKNRCYPFVIYFESKEMAEKAVKEVGEDRIKKYLFGVED